MGRDHTIYATQAGYVKYYKDPEKHPTRRYIGVVFKRDQVLPLPRNAARRRRLGMTTRPLQEEPEQIEEEQHNTAVTEAKMGGTFPTKLKLKPGTVCEPSWKPHLVSEISSSFVLKLIITPEPENHLFIHCLHV